MMARFVAVGLFVLTMIVPARGGEPRADAPRSSQNEPGWTPLFNGRDLSGWYTFLQKHGKNSDPERVITVEDGMIRLYRNAPEASEVVMGYIGTEKEYGDYHLRLEFRWGTKKFKPRYELKRDAGLYYHIIGPDAVWPTALQFQIEQTNVGDLITLHGYAIDSWVDPKTKAEAMPTFLPPERGGVEKKLGGKGISYQKHLAGDLERDGWNKVEIIVAGGTVTHLLNGHVINRGRGLTFTDPRGDGKPRVIEKGRIALEIEAAEIDYRNVEIRTAAPRP